MYEWFTGCLSLLEIVLFQFSAFRQANDQGQARAGFDRRYRREEKENQGLCCWACAFSALIVVNIILVKSAH